jgi:hypothetical protein
MGAIMVLAAIFAAPAFTYFTARSSLVIRRVTLALAMIGPLAIVVWVSTNLIAGIRHPENTLHFGADMGFGVGIIIAVVWMWVTIKAIARGALISRDVALESKVYKRYIR